MLELSSKEEELEALLTELKKVAEEKKTEQQLFDLSSKEEQLEAFLNELKKASKENEDLQP